MPVTTIYGDGTRIVGDANALEQTLHPTVMAYINIIGQNGYLMSFTEIDAVNNMVQSLVSSGIWNKILAIYPVIGGLANTHKFNLKDPRDTDAAFRLAFNGGGWTHSSTGMTPNGLTSWANTFLIPSTSLSVSSAHMSYYSRTQSLLAANIDMGASGAFPVLCSLIIGRATNSSLFTWGTQAANTLASFSSSSSQGFFLGNQNGATATGRNIFRNSVIGTSATSYGTPGLPTISIVIGAYNDSGGTLRAGFSSRQCALASIGSGFTNEEAISFSNIVQTFQTKLGRQV
jgi:hypothetical protein